jgi:hypothetical protein
MLTCLPRSICSWDFEVTGGASGPAVVEFNFMTEQGSITVGGDEYVVRKHGMFSGEWTLERGAEICAEAKKPSAFFRSFEVRSSVLPLTVEASSAFTRCFDIVGGGEVIGTIKPAHPFTRRSFIECHAVVPELVQLFSFWLAALAWRRAARNNNNNAT